MTKNESSRLLRHDVSRKLRLVQESGLSPIWQEAMDEHLAKLKPSDKAFCLKVGNDLNNTIGPLNASFQSLLLDYEGRFTSDIMDRVGLIAENILVFGRAIDAAVGSGPMAAGIIWGGIRLLLEALQRFAETHQKIVGMLETLSTHLPLFEKWVALFPIQKYPDFAQCIKKTCGAFIGFLVEAIICLQRSRLGNFLRTLFSPALQARFAGYEKIIKDQNPYLCLHLITANIESTRIQDQDVAQFLERSVSKATAQPNVVFPFRFLQNVIRNDRFWGRDEAINKLDSYLCFPFSSISLETRSVLIHGLTGTGKSSVAKEYMYLRIDEYQVVIWFYADTKIKLDMQCSMLIRTLGIPMAEGCTREAFLQWVNHLSVPFLLIFDNADDISILSDYWPSSVHGSIIITSIDPTTGEEGFAQHGIHLNTFSDKSGAEFLKYLLGDEMICGEADLDAINLLSQQYGGWPLALRHAAMFMRSKRCSPVQFLAIYRSQFTDIDSYRVLNNTKTVIDAWKISINGLSNNSRAILDIAALFDPDSIPVELFHTYEISSQHGDFMKNPLEVLDAIGGLVNQSLVEYNQHKKSLKLHRFFQTSILRNLSTDSHRFSRMIHLAVELIHSYLPASSFSFVRQPQAWERIQQITSHVLSLHSRVLNNIPENAAKMLLICLSQVVNYGYESGQYNLGVQMLQKAERLVKKISNPDHRLLSQLYFYQTRICQEECRHEDSLRAIQRARSHIEEASIRRPAVLDSPLYVRILSNQGIAYLAVGNYAESEKLHKEAIQHCYRIGKQEECSIGNLMQNLGSCYLWGGDLKRAEETVKQSLLLPNSNIEAAKYTLGNVFLHSRRYPEALVYHKEALDIYIKNVGANHLTTADSWHKLGCIFSTPEFVSHNLEEAERCFRKTLEILQLPENKQNMISTTLIGRVQWKLSLCLDPKQSGIEIQQLQDEALSFLRSRFGDGPKNTDPSELFDSLVFYWSR